MIIDKVIFFKKNDKNRPICLAKLKKYSINILEAGENLSGIQ